MHRLFLFSTESGEREFVVISDSPSSDVIREYATGAITHDQTIDLAEDAVIFPCDEELRCGN